MLKQVNKAINRSRWETWLLSMVQRVIWQKYHKAGQRVTKRLELRHSKAMKMAQVAWMGEDRHERRGRLTRHNREG
jgi:hypothetical protein